MKTKTSHNTRKKSNWCSYFIIFIFIILIAILTICKDKINNSHNIQSFINLIQDYLLSHYNKVILLLKFYAFMNHYHVLPICVLILMYNFGNIFKTIILLLNVIISTNIIALMDLFYYEPRPSSILENPNLYVLIEEAKPNIKKHFVLLKNGTGFPCSDMIIFIPFFMAVWKMIFQRKNETNKFKYNRIFFIFFVLSNVIIISFDLIFYANSLYQILFGLIIGFMIYIVLFHIICLNCNDYSQLFEMANSANKVLTQIFLVFFYYALICLYVFLDPFKIHRKSDVIKAELSNNNYKYHIKLDMVELLVNAGSIFILPGIVLGLRFEFTIICDRNYRNWAQYNFEKEEIKSENEDQSQETLYLKLETEKEIQWNHTGKVKAIYRLLLICLLIMGSFGSFYIFGWNYENIIVVVLLKCVIPLLLCSFGFSFLFKQILKYLKATNILIFVLIRESI